jgi:dTDP-4-dehydrorhamnose reductase
MKILLFGASGQLGTEWQRMFAQKGDDYLIIPYISSQLDITRPEMVKHEFVKEHPDVVINCAAYTKVDEAEDKREQASNVNAKAVGNLAELCAQFDIKLVHFSTDYIFAGHEEDRNHFPNGYPEDHPAEPVNWYGQTKWEGEQAIRNSGCDHLILRASWLCGTDGNNFVKTMLRLGDEHDELQVVDDQYGSPTFADKLVKDTLKLIEQEREGTYHHTSKGLLSWADFAEAIFEEANIKVSIDRISSSEYVTKAKRPHFSKLNTGKIEQLEIIEMENWKPGLGRLINKINEI